MHLLFFSPTVEEYLGEAVTNAFQTAMSQSKQCADCVLGVVSLSCLLLEDLSLAYKHKGTCDQI